MRTDLQLKLTPLAHDLLGQLAVSLRLGRGRTVELAIQCFAELMIDQRRVVPIDTEQLAAQARDARTVLEIAADELELAEIQRDSK